MKVALLALGAGICFAQSTIQIQNGPSTGGPLAANAGTGQPFSGKIVTDCPFMADAVVETDQTLADGVQQIEPPITLFQIPSGYTIEEDGR